MDCAKVSVLTGGIGVNVLRKTMQELSVKLLYKRTDKKRWKKLKNHVKRMWLTRRWMHHFQPFHTILVPGLPAVSGNYRIMRMYKVWSGHPQIHNMLITSVSYQSENPGHADSHTHPGMHKTRTHRDVAERKAATRAIRHAWTAMDHSVTASRLSIVCLFVWWPTRCHYVKACEWPIQV